MALPSLDVRTAADGDVSDLVELYRTAYSENERIGFPSSMTSLERARVEGWLRTRSVFVGVCEGDLLGAVHLIPRPDWEVPELGRLVVEPGRQGRGLGTRLLEFGEGRARSAGTDRIRLRTLAGHPFLEDWYRRRGYRRIDVEPLDDRPYDAPVLEKEL